MTLEKIKICYDKKVYSVKPGYLLITAEEALNFLKNFSSNEIEIEIEKNKNITIKNNSFEMIFTFNKEKEAFNGCIQFKNF